MDNWTIKLVKRVVELVGKVLAVKADENILQTNILRTLPFWISIHKLRYIFING